MMVVSIVLALVLDHFLGEPGRFHPLIGFGRLVHAVERRFYSKSHCRGIVAVLVLTLPWTMLAVLVQPMSLPWAVLFDALVLYLAIGWNSLDVHAQAVFRSLESGDLDDARRRVGLLVSRDTAGLNHQDVIKATLESVLENGNDAVLAAIFWFVLAGAPGAILYRLVNTLDAMWGYRNSRYNHFGWCAARLDDALNLMPARLTALSYAIVGNTRTALHSWRTQASGWHSPNAGPVMAAGAGSLGVRLGGPACYDGVLQQRPLLGGKNPPAANDIGRALFLIRNALLLWLLVLLLGGCFLDFIARY